MKNFLLQTENLVAGYDKKVILKGVNIKIPNNKISVIIGSNASGKSTLLKTMSRLIKPMSGNVSINSKSIDKIKPKSLAKVIGLLPQSPIVPEGITVADLVGRGRFPHQSLFGGWSKEDYQAVSEAMEVMGVLDLANRNIDELSGGQRQRVWIAMAIAQKTDILFLDEPTTFLDVTYQIEILDALKDINQKYGTTIVMVLHDINLSIRYSDYIFVMNNGEVETEGDPKNVITSELVNHIFKLDNVIIKDPVANTPFIIPKGRFHN